MLPFHRYFGASIFGVSAAQVLLGQMEYYWIKRGIPIYVSNSTGTPTPSVLSPPTVQFTSPE